MNWGWDRKESESSSDGWHLFRNPIPSSEKIATIWEAGARIIYFPLFPTELSANRIKRISLNHIEFRLVNTNKQNGKIVKSFSIFRPICDRRKLCVWEKVKWPSFLFSPLFPIWDWSWTLGCAFYLQSSHDCPTSADCHQHLEGCFIFDAIATSRDSDYAALQDFSQLMRDLRLGDSKEHIYGE